jgi:hypothetical protein
MRDAACDLVEGGEDGDGILDGLGMDKPRRQGDANRQGRGAQSALSAAAPVHQHKFSLHHAAHLILRISSMLSPGALL